ncbi:outer membrane beta-barrel protein [Maribacter aestuarii]|uniref:outer membrane beta-barrel protein n=1 Tax=Maribacter aestuarii TaxID=1130723 RepID=UPI00248D12FF|nr:outer membrane beta-barrel protein [Maribacter aestuarii]
MKKFGVIAFFVLGVTFSVSAQQGFAVKAGINNVTAKVDLGSFGDASDSELGFYVGGGYNFELSDKIDLEPSALLSIVSDLTSLYIPVMFKYEVVESFNVQAGPQVNYLLEDVPDGALGIDLAVGGGYQFNENWFVEARYGFEISRGGDFGDAVDYNTLTIGAGYRFN